MAVFRSKVDPAELRARRRIAALSLAGLAVFLAVQALMVRSYGLTEKRPPSWDQSVHMEIALDYRAAYKSGRWGDIMNLAPKPGMPPFPPIYHLALMRAYASPDPAAAALWVNWFYLAIFTIALFFLCFAFRPDWGALGAAIAFAASPAIQELLFTQLIDLSVVALVAAGYWALVASEEFMNWIPSLLFGALFGVGMLHKWSFFSYFIPVPFLAVMGLSKKKSRLQVLAAAAIAVAIFFPWYYDHIAVLAPRLFQASSDFAVPVTRGGAFFLYFLISADTLGPFLWGLGWLGLCMPGFKNRAEQGWLIWAWALTSYLFWAIVPNRQMRFVLPGLPSLAVAMCGAWPTPVIWSLAAFQILGAVNYSTGWISEIHIPLIVHDFALFPSNAPSSEDWHIKDILLAAQTQSDPARPVANLTLVANAPYFNGANFTWLAKTLKLPTIHMRGVNKRLCEFSEFVVLKDDKLGPAGVTEGLPEAAKVILAPQGWFARAYEKTGAWPLPDGSNAVLFKQKKFPAPPFKGDKVQFTYYASGPFTASDFQARMSPWDKEKGVYPMATMNAAAIELRGVKVARPAIELDNVVFMPASDDPKAPEWDDVRFLKLDHLKINSAAVSADDLKTYVMGRVPGLRIDTLSLNKTVSVSGEVSHFSFAVEFAVDLLDAPRRLKITVLHARLGATTLPAGILGAYREFSYPLGPNPETPFDIDLAGLTLRDGELTIP